MKNAIAIRSFASGVFLALLAAHASAQPCYAENDTNNYFGALLGGPNLLLAIRFTPPTHLNVNAIEVFTGMASGTNTVGIWSHNAGLDQPLANLGTASWAMSSTISWQGASLTAPISLIAGTTYWVVWGGVPNSLTSFEQTPSLGQPYCSSFTGGAPWNGPMQSTGVNWKFRLYCDPCPGSIVPYGAGCAGTLGVPTLPGIGCATPGGMITMNLANGLPHANGLILIGLGTGTGAVTPTCSIDNLPLFPVVLPVSLSATGTLTIAAGLPASTPVPSDVYLQTIFADAGAANGISASNALWLHFM